MKLGDFLAATAAKFGINTALPEFSEVLASGVDIPDTVANHFTTLPPMFTMEAARNNPAIKQHFTASILNGMDASIDSLMNEIELPAEIQTEIKGTSNTYQKVPALVKKIRELEAAKVGTSGKDKDALTTQINALNQKLAEAQSGMQTALTQKEEAHLQEMTELLLDSHISRKKLDVSRFPADIMLGIAKQKVTEELKSKGVKLKNINRTLQLKRAEEEALDYYENNAPVTLDSFIDQVLANNKLIAVTDPNPAPDNRFPGPTPTPTPVPTNRTPLSSMASKLDKYGADFNTATQGIV